MLVTNASAGQQPLIRSLYSAQSSWARDGTWTRASALLLLIGGVERRGARRRPIGGGLRWHVCGAGLGADGSGLGLQGLWRSSRLGLQYRAAGPLSFSFGCLPSSPCGAR